MTVLTKDAETPGLTRAQRAGFPERYYPAAVAVFLVAFSLYAFTLAPGLMPGDTPDMTQAAASFREAHPPGYPLYSALGKVFAALPIGDIPYRVNLMSAFLGGWAVALVFLAVLLLTRHVLASVAAAFLFGFNYLFWTYFVLAETFCMNNFFLALLAFLTLLWRERHRQDPGSAAERRALIRVAFLAGLSLGNHHTMVLTFPGVVAFVAAVDRTALHPRRLLPLLACFAIGVVLPYLYLPLAAMWHPLHHWEDTATLKGVVNLFLRKKYGTFQLAPSDNATVTPFSQAESYFVALAGQYLWTGYLLGIGGLLLAVRKDRSFLLYSGGGFLLGLAFVLHANIDPRPSAYDAATLQRFYQLPNFFFVLWAGYGLAALARAVEGALRRTRLRPAPHTAILAAVLLAFPGALFAHNYSRASLRGNRLYPRFIANIYNSLPPNAIMLSWTDTVGMGVDYLSYVEKHRPDVPIIMMGIARTQPYSLSLQYQYPKLRWPAPVNGRAPRLRAYVQEFVSKNIGQHRIFVDNLPVKLDLPLIRHGLIYEILPAGSTPSARQVLATNEDLWKRFDLRQVDTTLYPANSMCYSVVVFYYLFQRFSLASDMSRFQRYEDSIRHLEACAAMDRFGYVAHAPPWRRQMARSYIGLGRLDEALQHLQTALQTDRESPETYLLLSTVYQKKGDTRRAQEYSREYRTRGEAEDRRTAAEEAAKSKTAPGDAPDTPPANAPDGAGKPKAPGNARSGAGRQSAAASDLSHCKLQIANCKLQIVAGRRGQDASHGARATQGCNCRLPICSLQNEACHPGSGAAADAGRQSAICNLQFAICNLHLGPSPSLGSAA